MINFKPDYCQCEVDLDSNGNIINIINLCKRHINIKKENLIYEFKNDTLNNRIATSPIIVDDLLDLRLDAIEALVIGEQSTLSKIRDVLKI